MQSILISEGNENLRELKAQDIIKSNIDISKPTTDLYIVSADNGKTSIAISQIREMISVAHLHPRNNEKSVIWIKDAHYLTTEAQNAMLKILEEPPEYLVFILTADHHDNLIDTVRSRCSVIRLGKPSIEHNSLNPDSKEDVSASLNISIDVENLEAYDIEDLIDKDHGEIIDWSSENLPNLDRNTAVSILNLWEVQLKQLLDKSIGDSDSENGLPNLTYINNALQELYTTRELVLKRNANIKLAIESYLLHLG